MSVPVHEPFDGMRDLGARLERSIGRARALLSGDDGHPSVPEGMPHDDPEQLRTVIDALTERLAELRGGSAGSVVRDHQGARDRLSARYEARFDALERVRGAVDELRRQTSPATMLERAPQALCGASSFRRSLLSLVGEGQMIAEAAHFTGDRTGAAQTLARLRTVPLRLEHPLIETEVVRRRRATLVVDARMHARVDPGLQEAMRWRAYAAAPLFVGSTVIGVLHADRGRDSELDVLDRDVLWEFASALTHAYESAHLRRTLRHERQQMRRFLDWLDARSGELTDAPIRLATAARPVTPERAERAQLPLPGRDDRAIFEGLMTRRELDVLRLLADGHSNRMIAEALVITEGTVKFHVNRILRKLRVTNRAQAVSRYLRLLGMRTP
jgi:DNA-binding CsgD family transcriptional regulator